MEMLICKPNTGEMDIMKKEITNANKPQFFLSTKLIQRIVTSHLLLSFK